MSLLIWHNFSSMTCWITWDLILTSKGQRSTSRLKESHVCQLKKCFSQDELCLENWQFISSRQKNNIHGLDNVWHLFVWCDKRKKSNERTNWIRSPVWVTAVIFLFFFFSSPLTVDRSKEEKKRKKKRFSARSLWTSLIDRSVFLFMSFFFVFFGVLTRNHFTVLFHLILHLIFYWAMEILFNNDEARFGFTALMFGLLESMRCLFNLKLRKNERWQQ